MMLQKKASLNISIEAIVIIVIAFVVLGLGLGFVRSQFSSIEGTSTAVQEQISQQILDDLRTGNKPLSFPASKLVLETGQESVQAIGVKNTGDSPLSLKIGFEIKSSTKFDMFSSAQPLSFTSTAGDTVEAAILWDDSSQELKGGDTVVVPVTITAPDRIGNYLYKVILTDEGTQQEYATKTFFVKTT